MFAVIPSAPNDQTVDPLLVPHSKGKMEFHHGEDQEDLLEELSEEQIASLLEEASTRLRQRVTTSGAPELDTLLLQPDTISFPKLDPGPLPKPYIETSGTICRITSITTGSTNVSINDPVTVVRTKQSNTEGATAGKQWFDMPLTSTDSQTLRDIQLIRMREVLDPHRHYKKNILNRVPKYSQMGTIIADHSEFYSARLTNRERKKTILEEIMSDARTIARFKQKRRELHEKSRAGGKEYYKKVKERRKKKK